MCRTKARNARMVRKADEKSVAAIKILLTVLGIGIVTGAAVVVGVHGIVKKMFVNERWPGEEWSSDDWAEEDLEN